MTRSAASRSFVFDPCDASIALITYRLVGTIPTSWYVVKAFPCSCLSSILSRQLLEELQQIKQFVLLYIHLKARRDRRARLMCFRGRILRAKCGTARKSCRQP